MKKLFQPIRLASRSRTILMAALEIIESYAAKGYTLSLRQLYYQLVAANLVPNTEQSYKRVGELINNARLGGLADWDMIEDRNRETLAPAHWASPNEILLSAADSYRIDKWADQPNYVEVMVEKAALEGVLSPVCTALDIPFTSNRGYSSASMMYATGERLAARFRSKMETLGLFPESFQDARTLDFVQDYILTQHKEDLVLSDCGTSLPLLRWSPEAVSRLQVPRIVILYLGDHDPSGIDMTRDVSTRLAMFSDRIPLEVHRLALNMDQIRQLRPPENPAKLTDSRASSYVRHFGLSSWELDAISPEQLASLVETAVVALRDNGLWERSLAQEKSQRSKLLTLAHSYKSV